MTEILHPDFKYGYYNRSLDKAWDEWYSNRHTMSTINFDNWLKENYNLKYEVVNEYDVKIVGDEKDLTWFLLRYS